VTTQTAGQRFAAKVRADFELSTTEELLLDELADAIDKRRSASTDSSARGWAVIVSRLVAQLGLDQADAPTFTDGKSRRAQAASRARWSREKGAA
jgi:hypothetical protein